MIHVGDFLIFKRIVWSGDPRHDVEPGTICVVLSTRSIVQNDVIFINVFLDDGRRLDASFFIRNLADWVDVL